MRKPIPLGGQSRDYHSRLSREQVINAYIQINKDGSFKRISGTPGFTHSITLGTGPIRCTHIAAGVLYVVSGNEFYRVGVAANGGINATLKGEVAGFNGPCTMDSIGTDFPQVMALTNGRGFIYDTSTDLLTEVTDVDFTPDYSVASFNGRFWFNKPDSNEFFASDILDGFVYDPLFFASAENNPDKLAYILAVGTELVLMGTQSIERWQDIGITTGFYMRRITGGTISRGVGARASVVQWENTVFWLADDFTVRMLSGGQMQKISDLALDLDVQSYNFPERAYGKFIDSPYYKCYCITFPGNDVEWCYDVMTGAWHQRDSIGVDGWRISDCAIIFNQVYLGDKLNGNLYIMERDVYTENGSTMAMTVRTPPIGNFEAPITVSRLELIADAGVGLISNQVPGLTNNTGGPIYSNEPIKPKIGLKVLKNGKNPKIKADRSLGRIGDDGHKIIWRALGRVRRTDSMMFEFTITDPVERNLYKAEIDTEVGVV